MDGYQHQGVCGGTGPVRALTGRVIEVEDNSFWIMDERGQRY